MIFDLLARTFPEQDLEAVFETFASGRNVRVAGLRAAARAFYLTLLSPRLRMPVVCLVPTVKQAEDLFADLVFLEQCFHPERGSAGSRVVTFPAPDTEPYQGVSPHPQISVQRMQALWRLTRGDLEFLVAPIQAAARVLPPPENLQRSFDVLDPENEEGPIAIAAKLRGFGYREKDLVTSRGEFSLRGGILDFYSPAEDFPIRVEFFGNRIESLRAFDTTTQRSIQGAERATVLALREILLTKPEIDRWGEFSSARWSGIHYHEELADRTQQLLELGHFEGCEEFASAFFSQRSGLLDYIPGDCCIVLEEPHALEDQFTDLLHQYRKRFEQVHEQSRLSLEPEEIFHDWDALISGVDKRYRLSLCELIAEKSERERDFEYAYQPARQYNGQVQEIVQDALRMRETGFTSYFILPTPGKAERLAEILKEYEAPVLFFQHPTAEDVPIDDLTGKILISLGALRHGFRNPEAQIAVFTEDDLFGESRPVAQAAARKPAGKFLSDLRDLKIEDFVVHVDHGIGQFMGLTAMEMAGQDREFLLLRFADDDKLYLPVERLDLVQKYMGASEVTPKLDKLGTMAWQKAKSRAKASMKDMAEKLLQLYAYRKAAKGFSFAADDAFQHEFDDAFEFQETAHQLAAIEDVKGDMETDKPMDRLICGDVGYGKTEVAMRAAFKAVSSGKQVAVLAPTTILAFQHLQTFRKRFEMFPVKIGMVSRFKSRAEIKQTLEDAREGRLDILIGTHRLLSKDVYFHDLGLLIVDEEQRFGVTHKEKIKEMKKNVDALTLTATPIPRTLQMALMGFRPMSVIETPPKDRLAIQTNIVKYDEDLIGAAVRAELKRGGQVYFVHNRVETIHSIASMVQRLVPEAKIAIAHGQMEEKALEKVMMQFINQEHDVLVSTTIIENGIDIPLVNTLVVNRADRFGLSQLYQLRGRVGRSHRRAYAYFLIPSERDLTPVARRRLAALREFTDLGSGFRLAALDLEIRGAGNLLGGEQHGHIAALGFELYCRMLEQTVRELQGEEEVADFSTNINLNIDIRIPEGYIPNMNQRLNLYKRVATIQSQEHLQLIRDEMSDRFGPIPDSVDNLLQYGIVKLRAEKLKIRSIDRSDGTLFFQFSQDNPVAPETILAFIRKYRGAALSPAGVLSCPAERLHQPEFLFPTVNQWLRELTLPATAEEFKVQRKAGR